MPSEALWGWPVAAVASWCGALRARRGAVSACFFAAQVRRLRGFSLRWVLAWGLSRWARAGGSRGILASVCALAKLLFAHESAPSPAKRHAVARLPASPWVERTLRRSAAFSLTLWKNHWGRKPWAVLGMPARCCSMVEQYGGEAWQSSMLAPCVAQFWPRHGVLLALAWGSIAGGAPPVAALLGVCLHQKARGFASAHPQKFGAIGLGRRGVLHRETLLERLAWGFGCPWLIQKMLGLRVWGCVFAGWGFALARVGCALWCLFGGLFAGSDASIPGDLASAWALANVVCVCFLLIRSAAASAQASGKDDARRAWLSAPSSGGMVFIGEEPIRASRSS